jgi:hypothetical protein
VRLIRAGEAKENKKKKGRRAEEAKKNDESVW